jgi:hypothetical protein
LQVAKTDSTSLWFGELSEELRDESAGDRDLVGRWQ